MASLHCLLIGLIVMDFGGVQYRGHSAHWSKENQHRIILLLCCECYLGSVPL